VVRVLRSPLDSLSCTLLPASCSLCGSPLPQLSSVPICAVCWTEIPALSGAACARCGDGIKEGATPSRSAACRVCRLVTPPFERAVAFGLYQGRMRDAIHALKYDRIRGVESELGRMLAEAIAKLAGEAPQEMLVVPVPLHRAKYAERGFNQARVLASEALRFLSASHPDWKLTLAASTLMRLRATQSQAGLTPRERRLNLKGAFSVSDAARVKSRHILLIDDILTTGATARAAAKALVDAGAESVWVATLARARRVAGSGVASIYMDRDDDALDKDDDVADVGQGLVGAAESAGFNAVSSGGSELRQPSF
jgi:ComF family protein